MPKEAPPSVYDKNYSLDMSTYDKHYEDSWYYPLYKTTLDEVCRLESKSVLEVGCGIGFFAQLLFDKTDIEYRGFDFSKVAVQQAQERTGKKTSFYLSDARLSQAYSMPLGTIVCMEVLEHIEADLDVVTHWPPGTQCVCSVPNFDDDTHVRLFQHEDEVLERYGKLINIKRIVRVPRPLFRGRSLRLYFRQLRWSRDNPKKLLAHLGYKTFDNLAGWFVFSGRRY